MVLNYFNNPTVLVISAIVMVMALILHNVVQTYVAARFGDTRAKFSGFGKFDPQQQLEPYGVLFMFLLGFGWPKQIPTEGRNYRGSQEALVWYSGPLTYLVVALLSYIVGVLLGQFGGQQELFQAFAVAGNFAITHAVINIFPVYPLDGAKAAWFGVTQMYAASFSRSRSTVLLGSSWFLCCSVIRVLLAELLPFLEISSSVSSI